MPTLVEVERAALKLRRAGERVSVRNVRRLLPRGGSYGTIGPLLARWKADADYRAGQLPAQVPAGLAAPVDRFVSQLWAAAKAEAEKVIEVERRRLDLLERVHEGEAVAAWSEVDRLNEVVAELTRRVRELEREAQATPAPLPKTAEEAAERLRMNTFVDELAGKALRRTTGSGVPAPAVSPRMAPEEVDALLRPLEAGWIAERDGAPVGQIADSTGSVRRFWDGVMREAAAVIRASKGGALGAAAILARLSAGTVEGAERFGGIDETILRKKMRIRVAKTRYFRELGDDRFGLLDEKSRAAARSPRRGKGARPQR